MTWLTLANDKNVEVSQEEIGEFIEDMRVKEENKA